MLLQKMVDEHPISTSLDDWIFSAQGKNNVTLYLLTKTTKQQKQRKEAQL